MITSEFTETIPTLSTPTFLTWAADETGALHLIREPLIQCPECGDWCGHLYRDEDTPAGACLSCKIDDDVIAQREELEDERSWGECFSTCGID